MLEWRAEVDQYIKYVERQHALFDEFATTGNKIVDSMAIVLKNAQDTAKVAENAMNSMIQTANIIIVSVVVLAVVLAIAAGVIVALNITRGTGSAVEVMNHIVNEGDLSVEISQANLNRKDEVGDLSQSLNNILEQFHNVEGLATKLAEGDWRDNVNVRGEKDAMNVNLASMLDQVNNALHEINENVRQVATGAGEVSSASMTLSSGAQETTELISKSGQEIENGGTVASRTAEVLNTIVDQIKQTTELVAGIAVASNEQAQGVAQITVGLQQIDQVTQQNTAAAEESASAANEMSSMASNLQQLVAKFKLKG